MLLSEPSVAIKSQTEACVASGLSLLKRKAKLFEISRKTIQPGHRLSRILFSGHGLVFSYTDLFSSDRILRVV